jgi:hypothetical protein
MASQPPRTGRIVTSCILLAAIVAFQLASSSLTRTSLTSLDTKFDATNKSTAFENILNNNSHQSDTNSTHIANELDATAAVQASSTRTSNDATINATTANYNPDNHTTSTTKLPYKRTQTLNPKGKFSFVHISKAAGSTWIRTLLNLHLDTCPDKEAGQEYPVWYQNNKICTGSDHHMLSLRSPRHHVWSLFTECKYDAWGKKVTNGLGFPRSGNSATHDEKDFDKWLRHFLPMDFRHQDNYKCYHPANFQTRYLESHVSGAHGVVNRPKNETRFEGNLTLAYETYWEQEFVAVVEMHHESLCLLYHRLGQEAPRMAKQYLDSQCVCPKPMTADTNLKNVHVVHHENGHRNELRDLPLPILEKIAILTAVDQKLYILALGEIVREIAWLESRLGLDRRVLCDDVLETLEPQLEYLNVSVSRLYEGAKAEFNE